MKKALFFVGALLAVGTVSAQQRLILAESFSQASCGPCAAQNPAFHALLDANTSKIIAIKYQVSWPGYDPMYEQNPDEIDARVDYYGISGVPDRVMDGTNMDVTQAAIDARYAVASPVTMNITNSVNGGYGMDVDVTITAPAVWNPSNTVCHIALVEKHITFATAPGTNGETEFKNVMRKMVSGTAGIPVVASNFSSAGGSQTFSVTDFAIPPYIYDMQDLALICWVQNTSTKEVYQAGMSDVTIANLNNYGIIQSASVPSNYNCATELSNATVVLENPGDNAITSATVHYQIDNGTVQTAPFTGNIAVGGTANFTLPTVASPSGSHVLTTYLSNINNSGFSNPLGTKTTTYANISDPGTTGAFSQNFSATNFPYTNYHLSTTTATDWAHVNVNSGCLYFDFYAFTAGKTGNAYIAPVNLSTIPSPTLEFDVAYRQYQGENDKLEVFVSDDCGVTWTSVYDKAGATLATLAASTTAFVPASASDWRTESVSLSNYASDTKVHIMFKATSAYGNRLFLDNINIADVTLVTENEVAGMEIYPNPASDVVNVKFDAKGGNYNVAITDLAGRTVATQSVENAEGAQTVAVPVSGLAGGNYIVTIKTEGAVSTQKVVIK